MAKTQYRGSNFPGGDGEPGPLEQSVVDSVEAADYIDGRHSATVALARHHARAIDEALLGQDEDEIARAWTVNSSKLAQLLTAMGFTYLDDLPKSQVALNAEMAKIQAKNSGNKRGGTVRDEINERRNRRAAAN